MLTDDILVTDGVDAFAGPRCVDLRQPVPGAVLPTRLVRGGDRLRVGLPRSRPASPRWMALPPLGRRPTLTRLPGSDLLTRLASQRSFGQLASDPVTLLSIGALPAWELARPRDWAALDDTHRLLVDAVVVGRGSAVPVRAAEAPGRARAGQPGTRSRRPEPAPLPRSPSAR
ncbi:hypothetical protein NKG94_09805 [Micromonospora sp. M12]